MQTRAVDKNFWSSMTPSRRVFVVSGLLLVCLGVMGWLAARNSVADRVKLPLVAHFPTKAGEQLERELPIAASSSYVLSLMLRPENLNAFKAQHSQIPCNLDVRITKGDEIVLRERINVLELRLITGRELGYVLVRTTLLPGTYNLSIDNHQDISYPTTVDPVLFVSINSADLETRVLIHDILGYLCPAVGLVGIVALAIGFLWKS